MEEETFDYSEVPYAFGLCAAEDCSHADTCLRQIAYNHAPASVVFPPTLNLKALKDATGECKYYLKNEKVRYAKGFVRTITALTVGVASTFRSRLVAQWGFKKYYQKRKGEKMLSPAEQQMIITLAKKLGSYQEEYFDAYVYGYKWE